MAPTNCGRNSPLVIDLVSPISSPRSANERCESIIDLLLEDDECQLLSSITTACKTNTVDEAAIAYSPSPKRTGEDATSLKRAREYSPESPKSYDHSNYCGVAVKKRPMQTPTFHPLLYKTNPSSATKRIRALPLVVIRDDGVVATDLLCLLDKLNLPMAVTCTSRSSQRHLSDQPNNLKDDYDYGNLSSLVLHHIQQRDKWSCGFRNLQMLLTAVLPYHPQLETTETNCVDKAKPTTNVIDIPTVLELQCFLEQCWAAGYDSRGAQHYQYHIVGKCSQIGAVEVSTVLAYQWGLDSTVIQFIKCPESRRRLPHFVWNYFYSTLGTTNECFRCRNASALSTFSRAKSLLNRKCAPLVLNGTVRNGLNLTEEDEVVLCACPVLPLYLQWEGHSVTIVGIERNPAKSVTSAAEVGVAGQGAASGMNLLVFDPGHSGDARKREMNQGDPSRMRIDCNKLTQKDCQIVMCSLRCLSTQEKLARKKRIEAVTASKEAVMRQL